MMNINDRSKAKSVFISVLEPELTAVVKPATVTEGEGVHLSCESGCPSLHPRVAWFREGQQIRNSGFQATTKDAGRYSCVVRDTEASRSASVALNVQCEYISKHKILVEPFVVMVQECS